MIELLIDHQPRSIGSSEAGPQSMNLATEPGRESRLPSCCRRFGGISDRRLDVVRVSLAHSHHQDRANPPFAGQSATAKGVQTVHRRGVETVRRSPRTRFGDLGASQCLRLGEPNACSVEPCRDRRTSTSLDIEPTPGRKGFPLLLERPGRRADESVPSAAQVELNQGAAQRGRDRRSDPAETKQSAPRSWWRRPRCRSS